MKLLGVLVALMTLAGSASAADPFEQHPYHMTSIVTVDFGHGDSLLPAYRKDWGRYEVGRFGPFTVGADGTVYLADIDRNAVLVFSPTGAYRRSIPMLKRPNLVDDLVVQDGALYWLGNSMFGPKAYRLDLATGDTLGIWISNDPQLQMLGGKRTSGILRLEALPTGVGLVKRTSGERMPLVQAGRILAPTAQLAAKSVGSLPDLPTVGFTLKDTVTTSGERTYADIVCLDAVGRPEKILLRNAGPPEDQRGRYFFMRHLQQEHSYYVVMDLEGNTLTWTRIPRRILHREINLAKEFELREDGSFYELYLSEETGPVQCHIVHWSR
jgi:hypothetical protein